MDDIDKALAGLGGGGGRRRKPTLRVAEPDDRPAVPGLVLDERGKVDPCLHNATAIIAAVWPRRAELRYDRFSGRMMLGAEQLDEATELDVAAWLQRGWNSRIALGTAQHALRALGFSQSFDALEDHVRGLVWDGVPRVDGWAPRLLGTADTPYSREVGRVLLLSMAARALWPGCRVHTVPILEGGQGVGKSTVCQVLGGPFFAELEGTFGTKEAAEQVEGAWLVEIGELDALSRAEANAVKAFVSRSSDRFRRAYARNVTDIPRRNVMVGTTNSETYLRDETGARRFLPIRLGDVDLAALRAERDQLLAEAVHRVEAGEPWWVSDEEVNAMQREEAEGRRVPDPWEDRIELYVRTRQRVTVSELLSHLGVETQNQSGAHQNRVAKSLKIFGFVRRRFDREPGRPWGYVREITSNAPSESPNAPSESKVDGAQKDERFQDVPQRPIAAHRNPNRPRTRAHAQGEFSDFDGFDGGDGFYGISDGAFDGADPTDGADDP